MSVITLKISEELLEESRRLAGVLKLSRSEYMRRAIERRNREVEAALRAERIAEVSRKVRAESSRVNAEFARVETDPED